MAAIRQERRKIADLKPAEYNPRKRLRPGDEEYERLKRSIETFGYVDPIIVNADGTVIGGHQRLFVLQELGFSEADVAVVDLSKPDEKALNVALNKISGEWDDEKLAALFVDLDVEGYDLTLTGFDEAEYDEIASALTESLRAETLTDPDDIPEINEGGAPTTMAGDLWKLGKHRLLCGDSTMSANVKTLFGGSQPYCIVTDPPYCSGGFQETGKSRGSIGSVQGEKIKIANDTLSTRGYMSLMKNVLAAAGDVGCAYMFTDWRMWINLFDVAEASGYGVRSMIVWNKETPGMGLGWRAQHELCMFASRSTQKFTPKKGTGNVVTCKRSGNALHPTQKPVELISTILEVTDFAGEIYDPFGGSGTTLIACEEQGRTCYMMELTPNYCDTIVRRYVNTTGKRDVVLVRGGVEIPISETGILNE